MKSCRYFEGPGEMGAEDETGLENGFLTASAVQSNTDQCQKASALPYLNVGGLVLPASPMTRGDYRPRCRKPGSLGLQNDTQGASCFLSWAPSRMRILTVGRAWATCFWADEN